VVGSPGRSPAKATSTAGDQMAHGRRLLSTSWGSLRPGPRRRPRQRSAADALVTRAVLQGASTADIAEQLVVSTHTVQQRLKAIFDKTGVHSRRDLVGKVFFSHYEPRLRDNERRTGAPPAADHLPLDPRASPPLEADRDDTCC
jgi:DNA-binding CsgD family transcriptional regulator